MHQPTTARSVSGSTAVRGFFVSLLALLCLASPGASQQRKQPPRPAKKSVKSKPLITPGTLAALDHISADSLRGHLSFIASDLLAGRDTPSPGLDVAAEYIAAQFRRAGLEPGGAQDASGAASYFQTADWPLTAPNAAATASPAEGAQTVPPAKVRNVIGLLRGSDPVLKDSYVIVSAHYDHIGAGNHCRPVAADSICNGANDDGSGTVSVIELAAALGKLKQRPKRSLVFITWFGEEEGLLGSRYYRQHPVYPLAQTVAMVNLELLGRTDSSEGLQVNTASLTGFDFTDLGPIFKAAGQKTGVNVYKHERNSDAFFGRSDNQALADAGVPAHTLCVAFVYPDYHAPGDHWEKIDYANMARVNRMIALALVTIADNPEAPKWNEANPKTTRYVQAWRALQNK